MSQPSQEYINCQAKLDAMVAQVSSVADRKVNGEVNLSLPDVEGGEYYQ